MAGIVPFGASTEITPLRTGAAFFCLLFSLPDAESARAETTDVAAAATESLAYPKVPRPSYKKYRGNSRSKKKRLGFFRRRAARRKAVRKKNAAPVRKGVISVDAPKGTMPAKQ